MKTFRIITIGLFLLIQTAFFANAQNRLVVYQPDNILTIEYVDTIYYQWNNGLGNNGEYEQVIISTDSTYTIPISSIDSMRYHGYVAQSYGVVHTGHGIPQEGLVLLSYEDIIALNDTVFNIDASYGNLTQLLVVARASDTLPMMLYRGSIDEESPVHIDAASTTLALVTMHPELISAQEELFDTLSNVVVSLPSYPSLLHQVQLAVSNQRPLSDTTNILLLDALSEVVAQLMADIQDSSKTNLLNQGPVWMTSQGNRLHLFTHSIVGIAPAYYGTMKDADGYLVHRLHVPTHEDWGVISFLINRFVNHNTNYSEGSHCEYDLTEGDYNIDLQCNNLIGFSDFFFHTFFMPIINQIGLSNSAECIASIVSSYIENIGYGLFISLMDAGTQYGAKDIFVTLMQSSIEWLIPQIVDEVQNIIDGESNCFKGVELDRLKMLTKLVPVMRIYGIGKDVGNCLLRVGGYLYAWNNYPEINKCVSYIDNYDITTCLEESLELVSGNNQEGVGGEMLDDPIKIRINITNGEGSFISLDHDYALDIFCLSNEGSVNSSRISIPGYMFEYDETDTRYYDVEIRWTLGINNDHQQLGFVLRDVTVNRDVTDTLKADAYLLRPILNIISGDDQNGNPGRLLASPIVIQLVTPATANSPSEPLPNHTVKFYADNGSGSPVYSYGTTDVDGYVSNFWRLGDQQTSQWLKAVAMHNGTSSNEPCSDTVFIDATMVPFHVEATSGDNQYGIGGMPLPSPIQASVTEMAPSNSNDNLANTPHLLRFWTDQGCGTLASNSLTTNSIGNASNDWILGTQSTIQHAYAAVFPSATATYSISDTVTFTATLLQPLLQCTEGNNQWGDMDSTLSNQVEITFFSTPDPNDPNRTTINNTLVHLWAHDSCGTLSDTLVRTDANGVVRTSWTLGRKLGIQTIEAQAVADNSMSTTISDAISIYSHIRNVRIDIVSGQNQTYGDDTIQLSDPLVFRVSSRIDDNSPIHTLNYPVELWIESGSGSMSSTLASGNQTIFSTAIITPVSNGTDSIFLTIDPNTDTNIVGCQLVNPYTLEPWGEPVYFIATRQNQIHYFSISATNQAIIAKGNLQYRPSTNTWRFAEHQYDYIGTDNINLTNNDNTYPNWIDLFSWSTGYMPTYVPTNNDMYNNGFNQFYDWGVHPIINSGNIPLEWRTPTSSEWSYIISNRPNASNLIAYGTVAGTHGLILLPDNWVLPPNLSFTPQDYNWNTNVYDTAAWHVMENAGAIFLPASGGRSLQSTYSSVLQISGVENKGFYWSATAYISTSPYDTHQKAYYLSFFNNPQVYTQFPYVNHNTCYIGMSVRMIKEIAINQQD